MTLTELVQKILDDLPPNVEKPDVWFPDAHDDYADTKDAFLEWYKDSGNLVTIGVSENKIGHIYWSYMINGYTNGPRSGSMEYNGILPILKQLEILGFVKPVKKKAEIKPPTLDSLIRLA